ncbi:protein pigeon-like [Tubulanus polymorphus]|uniref:protein pigeon-like n=1 Tax=Tubulanus polymorphus TaxID=672921 RepID=UPI003DA28A36
MLDLSCAINCHADLLPFAVENSVDGRSNLENFRIVGFEKDGTILFSWDSVPIDGNFTEKITQLAVSDFRRSACKVIFIHDTCVHIVNASINQERTLVAFTCLESIPALGKSNKENKYENVYKGYVAEIIPQNRMFSLNIESINHIQLNFLYDRQKTGYNDVAERESRMLMLLHKDSVGLYHFPMARAGEGRLIMCDQPRREQMLKKFLWAQWDTVNQQLYVVQKRLRRSSVCYDDETPPPYYLTCYQFGCTATNYFPVFEVSLNLPVYSQRSYSRVAYEDCAPANYTPDIFFNMQVLTQPNGTFCVCYEHPPCDDQPKSLGKRRPSSVSTVGQSAAGNNNKQEDIAQYSVLMLHNEKTIRCVLPNVPKSSKGTRLVFSWLNDYLLVYCPGHFTHLLNVGIELEPCHHIISHDQTILPPLKTNSILVTVTSDRVGSGNWWYDLETQNFYKVNFDREKMMNRLEQDQLSPSMKLAVQHYATIHCRDIAFFKRIMEHIFRTPTSPEILVVLKEFLIASTFASTRRILEKDYMRLLPFTASETCRGYSELGPGNVVLAKIFYSKLPGLAMLAVSDDKHKSSPGENMWKNLQRHLQASKEFGSRFCHELVQKELFAVEMANGMAWQQSKMKGSESSKKSSSGASYAPPGAPVENISIIRRITIKAKSKFSSSLPKVSPENLPISNVASSHSRPPSRTGIILGPMPSFLGPAYDPDPLEDSVASCCVDLVCQYLKKFKKTDSKEKAKKLAIEYVKCMMQQSSQLCHIIWSILRTEEENLPLSLKASIQETELFYVYERYYLATNELGFPTAPMFSTFFTSLGFRALDFRLFLHYVDMGVLQLTEEFMTRVIEELDDSLNPDNVRIKYQLITKLPQDCARECLLRWNHPISRRHLVQEMVSTKMSKDSFDPADFNPYRKKIRPNIDPVLQSTSSQDSNSSQESSASGLAFPPLNTFVEMLCKKDRGGKNDDGAMSRLDKTFIEQSALVFTRKAGYSDFHINL